MDLQLERTNTLAHARTIIDTAKSAGRYELTPHEVKQLDADHARIRELNTQLAGRKMVDSVMSLASSEDFTDVGPANSVFSKTDTAGLVQAIKSRSTWRAEIPAKAVIGAVGLLPTFGQGVVPGLHPGAMFALSSLFANEAASGPSVRYYQMDSAVAEVVAEGAVKPDSGLAVTPKDALLVKLATTSTISDELSSDAPYLVRYIAEELQNSVVVAENAHIIGAFTTSGILVDTSDGDDLLDVLADQIAAQTAANGVVPSAVVVAPSVLSTLRKQRGVPTGNFIIDPLSAAPGAVHGVPLVATASTPANTAWVVSGRAATMFRRGPITVEVGTSGDDWVRNQTHLRCEQRVVCAVQRPSMISKITIS